ncbi:MAG: hypothetical protein ABEJ86_04410 [Halococcoides sp.]
MSDSIRIYFSRADFERTPSPFPDVELSSKRPDLYFEVDDQQGTTLLQESKSRGRQSDREDAGTCTHVELCVDLPPIPEDGGGYAPKPQFTHVGKYDISSDINANGYAPSGNDDLAFTGVLPLKGVLPHGGRPTAREYRFQIENLDTGAVTTLDASVIEPTQIGTLQQYTTSGGTTTLDHEPYYVNNGNATNNVPVGPNGWIEVPREDDLGTVQNPGNGAFARNTGLLVRFDSRTILKEAFDLTSPTVHEAGNGLDAADKSSEHAFAIKFETREVGAPQTVRTDTLSRIVISNTRYTQRRHPSWAPDEATLPGVVMIDIKQFMQSGNGCKGLSTNVDARVTAYNPHIDDVKVWIEGPGTQSQHSTHLTPSNGEVAMTKQFSIGSLKPCAYILWLRVSYQLILSDTSP